MIFDQFSRYRAVALACSAVLRSDSSVEAVGAARRGGAAVCDVGSGPYRLLGQFLPNESVTYVDPLLERIERSSEQEVLLPFDIFSAEDSVRALTARVVVSVDTYEHIPPNVRGRFLDRLCEVATEGIVLAFPCADTPESGAVDKHVNAAFREVFGVDYPWLAEHFEYGLPLASEASALLRQRGFEVQSFRQGRCEWLRRVLPLVIELNEFPFCSGVIEQFSAQFNQQLAQYDVGGPGYRVCLVATKQPLALPAELSSGPEPSTSDAAGPACEALFSHLFKELGDASLRACLAELRTIAAKDEANLTERQRMVDEVKMLNTEVARLNSALREQAEWAARIVAEQQAIDAVLADRTRMVGEIDFLNQEVRRLNALLVEQSQRFETLQQTSRGVNS